MWLQIPVQGTVENLAKSTGWVVTGTDAYQPKNLLGDRTHARSNVEAEKRG